MINDVLLDDYLKTTTLVPLQAMMLPMGNHGEHLAEWQARFNQLSLSEMYNEYKTVVHQLIHAELDEKTRLQLMDKVFGIASRLFVSLKQMYQNQTGFLAEPQQQALDTLLSCYYWGIMFYHSVWQRAASEPIFAHKKGIAGMINRQPENVSDAIIRKCLYGMMSLLREALYEKYLGYRQDINVIWRYLNACYRFMQANGWQNYAPKHASINAGKTAPSLQQIYSQCLLAHVINPYACRRPDLVELHEKSLLWSGELLVTPENAQRPYLFVNLLSDEPPQLQHAGMAFNPFSKGNECIFINLAPLQHRLQQVIANGQDSQDTATRLAARHAQIVLRNVMATLEVPAEYTNAQASCQAVVGFHHIHYMLANKSSLNNLIQAHTLPDRLRPRQQATPQLNKFSSVTIEGTSFNKRHLTHKFSYSPFLNINRSQHPRNIDYTAISQFQVQSLIAIRQADDLNKVWQLGWVSAIQQTPKPDAIPSHQTHDTNTNIDLKIEAWVDLFASNVVACGVRIQNYGSRPPHFMPALIIPKNPMLGQEQTSIMMARFGYNVDDKLIIRIDAKEVNICLTELVNMTDDIEQYAFVRLQ